MAPQKKQRPRVARSSGEYRRQFEEQIRFLDRSATAFDAGDTAEAKRLAVTLRVLLHSTSRSVALLEHLGVLGRLSFPDTSCGGIGDSTRPGMPLLVHETGRDAFGLPYGVYLAVLHDGPPIMYERKLPFAQWWRMPIAIDTAAERFSREDLVLALANQDGGAHVDAAREERIVRLADDNSLGYMVWSGQTQIRFRNNPVLEGVRQIAWEARTAVAVLAGEKPPTPIR